ncbi:MAG: TolC family protein [Planctomycetota bacterium]
MNRSLWLLATALPFAACQTYEPAPVDLAEHLRAFAVRLPEAPAGGAGFDLADGLDRGEARRVALAFNADCRLARLRAGVAAVAADHAGALPDPALGLDFARILEQVPYRWLASASLQLSLPLSGRLARERDLAAGKSAAERIAAHLAESRALDRVDRAFVHWSAATARAEATADLLARVTAIAAIADRLAAGGELAHPAARLFALERLQRADEKAAAEAEAHAAELELKHVLGLHPDAPVRFVPTLTVPVADAEHAGPEGLHDNPQLWLLAAEHAVAEHDLALEIARQWPDFGLAPGFGEEDAQPRALLGFTLPLPLFDGNRRAIAEARARRDLAAEALRAGGEQFVHDLARALAAHTAAAARAERIAEELVPLADQQLEDSRTLAERGQLDPLLMLDSLGRAHAAHLAAIAAAADLALAAADLNNLFWPDLAAPPQEPPR